MDYNTGVADGMLGAPMASNDDEYINGYFHGQEMDA